MLLLQCAYQAFLMTLPGKRPGVVETTTNNEGGLHVDAAALQWAKYLASKTRVRVKRGNALNDVVATAFTVPKIREGFQESRTVDTLKPTATGEAVAG